MKLQIHNHITIVKCCLGPLLLNKKLQRINFKYVFSKMLPCKFLLSYALIYEHLISQMCFAF